MVEPANISDSVRTSANANIVTTNRWSRTTSTGVKQLNLHHSKSATALLSRSLDMMQTKKQNLICLAQEPWIVNNQVKGFDTNKYNLLYAQIDDNRPRACIVTTKGIDVTFMPQFSNPDVTTALLRTGNEFIIICSIYLAGDSMEEIPGDTIRAITNHAMIHKLPLIVGGDVNAHHTVWGSSDTNHRGEKLLEFIASTDLEILNKGISPTFVTRNRSEVLDITVASQNIINIIKNWHVSNEDTLSDHREINFTIDIETVNINKFRNPRNTDWEVFKRVLSRNITKDQRNLVDLTDSEKFDKAVEGFNKAMNTAFIKACPESKGNHSGNSWWNPKLQKLRALSRRLLRIYLARKDTSQGEICHEILRRSRNVYTKEIAKAKRDSERNFFNKIEGARATSRLHKLLAMDPTQGPGILKRPDGSYTESSEESAKLLLDTHFPGNSQVSVNTTTQEIITHTGPAADMNEISIIAAPSRVEWSIFSFESYKSPGLDNIYPIMLKKSWNIVGKYVVNFYKSSLYLRYVPKPWQEVKVIFIPKPGKKDYTSPKSFRPISLSSFLLKGLERLIDRGIKESLEGTNTLNRNQHAFQQGYSTDTALHSLISKIEYTLSNKEFMVSTFMDVEGAFDNVSFEAINKHLLDCGTNEIIRNWISFMLSHRKINFYHKGEQVSATATRGTPQGGVLSPLLWLIVMNSLLVRLESNKIEAIGYADDLQFCCRGKDMRTISDRTQFAVKIVEEWCLEVGLRVNPAKSESIIFTKNRIKDGFTVPTLFGDVIPLKAEVKYLGVILDQKLNWRKHIENRIGKCLRVFWCCRSAIGKTWGLSPKCLLWIYDCIVKQMLAYGAFVWWQGTKSAVMRAKLNHLQRVACLCVTGAMSTTPQTALDILLSLPRLEDFIEGEAMKTAFRLKHIIRYNPYLRNTHVDALENTLEIESILGAPCDRLINSRYIFERNFDVIITRDLNDFCRVVQWANVAFYTDGSLKSKGSGYGIHCIETDTNESIPLGNLATIKQIEITAINECGKIISEHGTLGRIAIFTDSLGAVKALKDCVINSQTVLECRQRLQEISVNNEVRLVWIRGHSSIRGNETADELAKAAAAKNVQGPEPFLPIDYSIAKGEIELWVKERINRNWRATLNAEQTKKFITIQSDKVTKQLISLDKQTVRIAVGILTGHAKVNYYLKKVGIRDDPDCRLCGRAEETTSHLLCDCYSLREVRTNCLGDVRVQPSSIQNIHKLIEFFSTACNFDRRLNQIF